MITIERLPSSEFVPRPDLIYEDVLGLHELFKDLAFRANVLLVGPKGNGKTLSVAAWAAQTKTPIVTFDCSEDVRRAHLIGSYVIRGGETPFVLGPLTTAFEVANETGSCILALEECNALSPQMQKLLNSLTDFRRRIEVPEATKVFQLKDKAKLWVVGTMNLTVYAGVYQLNEDLKSRFRMIDVGYPTPDAELKIVSSVLKLKDTAGLDLIGSVIRLAHETRQKSLEYALSTRDVVQIVEDAVALGVEKAMRIAIGKFEGDDKTTVKQRMTSAFKVKWD